MTPELLNIGGRGFSFVKTRTYELVDIYKGQDSFLKIGPEEVIKKEMMVHEKFLSLGFPAAKILESGEFEDRTYFIEESMGAEHFGDMFARDCAETGNIRQEAFESFIGIVSKYAEAQLKERHPMDIQEFSKLIHVEEVIVEIPQLAQASSQAMGKVEESIRDIPAVLTHGDFNPHNIFPKGCIDLEKFAVAPAGYDMISCITQIENFPKEGDFEILGKYWFSSEQKDEYFEIVDFIYSQNGLEPVSARKKEFSFCRNMWSAVRMQRLPKLQAWRYGRYESELKDMLK